MVSITLSSLRLICAQQQWHLKSAASIYICFTSVKNFVSSLDAFFFFFFYVWPRDPSPEDCLTCIHTDAQIKQNGCCSRARFIKITKPDVIETRLFEKKNTFKKAWD